MIRSIYLLLLILTLPLSAMANRVSEVEDYYTERISKFLQSRFPHQPFTVIVIVDVDKVDAKKAKAENLPYFDIVEKEQDIWNKSDVPLSTLISYVDKVAIKVDLETDMDANELNSLHNQLFEYLKLSTSSDKIEVNKIKPKPMLQAPGSSVSWWVYGAIGLISFLSLLSLLQWSVRSLVKGLSTPLSELGKATQNLSSPNLGAGLSPAETSLPMSGHRNDSSYESRRMFKELFEENKDLFERPTIEVMEFLEEEGAHNPMALTSLFAEIKKDKLKEFFAYGTGQWWYRTLSTAPQITNDSLDVLFKLHKLKIKNQLTSPTQTVVDAEMKDFAVILNRLNESQIESLLKPFPFQTAIPILHLLPKSKAMKVCKNLFPGSWAQFIDPNQPKGKISNQQVKQIQQKALELLPLRNTQSLEAFFSDIEIEKYLDVANTWDEREFYKALTDNSNIKKVRTPFYKLFDLTTEDFNSLLQQIPVHDLVYILPDCERAEGNRIFEQLTERQRFRLRELMKRASAEKIPFEKKIAVKNQIRHLIFLIEKRSPPQDSPLETQDTKAA